MRHLTTVMLLLFAVSMIAVSAQAASPDSYQAIRREARVIKLDTRQPLMAQFAHHAGKIIEVDGTVSGILTGNTAGFLLQVDPSQTLVIDTPTPDTDIAVGNAVRVLGRIPEYGNALIALRLMRTDTAATPTTVPVQTTTTPVIPAPSQNEQAGNTPPTPIPTAATPAVEAPSTSAPTTTAVTSPAKAPKQSTRRRAKKKTAARPVKKTVASKPAAIPAPTKTAAAPNPAATPVAQSFDDQVKDFTKKVMSFNRRISSPVAWKIAYAVLSKAPRFGIDPRLVFALLAQESRFNPFAVSPVGARGLGQLMPATAALMGIVNPFDIYDNIDGTIRYLAKQLQQFGGNVSYALAAYNAGPGNVLRYGGIPPFRETQNYVQVISQHYNNLLVN